MKNVLFALIAFCLVLPAHAGQKLFSGPLSSLGTFFPLNSSPTWVPAGTLDFSMTVPGQFLITAQLDSKIDTCTGSCATRKGGSMMADLRVVNVATNEVVLSQRLNGGMAILSGGISNAQINHMLVLPVALNFPSRTLPAGNYRATLTLQNGTAYNMAYGLRQMIAQVFEN